MSFLILVTPSIVLGSYVFGYPFAVGLIRGWRLEGAKRRVEARKVAPRLVLQPEPKFNWLKEYGPLWTPESEAFWLAPSTADELAAWWTKYRPGETGFKMADNCVYRPVRIELMGLRRR